MRTYAWTNILGPRGYIANLTADLGHRVTLLGTDWGILIGMVAAYLPMMVLPVYVSLSRVSETWSRLPGTSEPGNGGSCARS